MKYSINAQGVPEAAGPYSLGTTAGRLVFTAGLVAVSESDCERLIEGGVVEQTERVIDLAEMVLAEVGCSLSDVAQTTVYLSDLAYKDAMDEVYARRFPTPAPARTLVGAAQLPLGALVQMDCVACR